MTKRKLTSCIICNKDVNQDTATSVERQTCRGEKIGGVWVKSACEKEKNRRYQKGYRNENNSSPRGTNEKSVAECGIKHLVKFKAKKYKRHCLKCNKKFTGNGEFNRICKECVIINSRTSHLRGV